MSRTHKCATCPRIIALSERQRGRIRCRWCRKKNPGQVMRQIVKPKPAKPRPNGIALLTRAIKKQPDVRRESFWTTAPRDGWGVLVQTHHFPQVPYGPLLVSWTRDYL